MPTQIIGGYSIDGSTLTLGSNNTIQVGQITDSNITAPTVNSLAGETAGTLYYIQVFSLSSYKKVLIYADGYENDTTTNQSITYPTAFATVAAVTANTTGLTVSTTTSALTITSPDSTTTYSGVIVVEGY